MSSLTRAEARDTINGLVKTAVDAYNGSFSPDISVYYDDTEPAVLAGTEIQFRVYIRHGESPQRTLGPAGSRVFERQGVVIVQVFTPTGDGFTLDDTLATVARNCFEGVTTSNGVWFRRTRVQEIGKSGKHYQTNVVTEFQYTERR